MFERIPTYLSPTSIGMYYRNKETFALNYLVTNRPSKVPQTAPMAAGSAFDAYVKNYIVENLYGKNHEYAQKFDLDTILRSQVESQNLDWATEHGLWILSEYRRIGALANLMKELEMAENNPRFELSVNGDITFNTTVGGIPLLGKPDCCFKHKSGYWMVIDWKVNGYCASKMASPKGGYIHMLDTLGRLCEPRRRIETQYFNGIKFNAGARVNKAWELQVVIYGWLLGVPFKEPFFVGIDQLLGQGVNKPLRCANHRNMVTPEAQAELAEQVMEVWEIVNHPDGERVMFGDDGTTYERLTIQSRAFLDDEEAIRAEGETSLGPDAEDWFNDRIR